MHKDTFISKSILIFLTNSEARIVKEAWVELIVGPVIPAIRIPILL